MKNLIKKHPVVYYFAITFGWTWLLVFGLILSGSVKDVSKPTPMFIIVGLACNISPTLAAIIVARVTKGKAGVKALLGKFKVKSRRTLYLLSLGAFPVVVALTTVISNTVIRSYKWNIVAPLLVLGLIWPLFSSFGEEFGWRGYILPQLLQNYSPLKAGLILGTVWSTWHLPMDYIGYQTYGNAMLPAFVLVFISLVVQSTIMTYIYVKGNGNLKLMILYHYTITGSTIILGGLLKTNNDPWAAVYESLVSVILLTIMSFILYTRKEVMNSRI
jgi:membrane protease YdiL (CAAX protease family)